MITPGHGTMVISSVLLLSFIVGAANAGITNQIGNLVHTNYCASKTVPRTVPGSNVRACATVYKAKRCKEGWWSGHGWTLPVGNTDFGMDIVGIGIPLNGAYTWRNNIESLQIAPGCTLEGFDDNRFGGGSIVIHAGSSQRDVLDLDNDEDVGDDDFVNDIESIKCTCLLKWKC